jgi:hypothetical protein
VSSIRGRQAGSLSRVRVGDAAAQELGHLGGARGLRKEEVGNGFKDNQDQDMGEAEHRVYLL